MEDFEKSFYTTSQRRRRNQKQILGSLLTLNFNPFLNNPNNLEYIKLRRKEINSEKHSYAYSNVGGEAQKIGQVCFAPGGLRIQPFWSDEHITAHQSCTKPPGRDQKAKEGQ